MLEILDNQELMVAFYGETRSLLNKMRKNLAALNEGRRTRDEIGSHSDDISSFLCRLARYAHTIKSSSGIVGFNDINEVAQALEKIFKRANDSEFVMNADVIALLCESVEVCHRLLNKEEVCNCQELLKRLNSILRP